VARRWTIFCGVVPSLTHAYSGILIELEFIMNRIVRASLAMTALAALALGGGCATFNARMATSERAEDAVIAPREKLAGATLHCAGRARETAIWLSISGTAASVVGGVLTSIGGSTLVGAPSTATQLNGAQLALEGAGAVVSLAGFVMDVAALVQQYDATQYDQRAGDIMAGLATEGCRAQ
jgi:hypothetical protein